MLPAVALDMGGAALRASLVASSSPSSGAPLELANCVAFASSAPATTLLGHELQTRERRDGGSKLRYVRPVERGYCVNWNVESELLAHLCSNKMLGADPREYALVATAPMFAPTALNEAMDQVGFEELGFRAFARVNTPEMCVLSYTEFCRQRDAPPALVAGAAVSPAKKRRRTAADASAADPADRDLDAAFGASSCHLVVDSGFSFTHIVPVIDGRVFERGVKRVNVGGKLLTNYLKEIVSFRQFNVADDTRVMNEAKEALCYCSLDFDAEMRKFRHGPRAERKRWVLPDFVHSYAGRLRRDDDGGSGGARDDDEQVLELGVELISVPEVLFHPSDIGLDQAGIAEAIQQAVSACPEELRGALYANVLLVGGNTKFGNFRARLERDLRPLVPSDLALALHAPPDPILAAWDGCTIFARQEEAFAARSVTKQEYDEHGSNICRARTVLESKCRVNLAYGAMQGGRFRRAHRILAREALVAARLGSDELRQICHAANVYLAKTVRLHRELLRNVGDPGKSERLHDNFYRQRIVRAAK